MRWRVVSSRPLSLVAAGVILAATSGCAALSGNDSQLSSVGAEDGNGTTCMPVSKDGQAWFAWESVENSSDSDLVVTGLRLDNDALDVDEWFLVDREWVEGGVGRGRLPAPGSAKLPSKIKPGDVALVALTVSADELTQSRKTRATLTYEVDGEPDELLLNWEIQVIPSDETCSNL